MDMQTRVSRKPEPLASRVDDDLVIFSARNGMYYGTQSVGHHIWSLLEHEISVHDLCSRLQQAFEVDRDTCEQEVLAFLGQLDREGLIDTR